MKVPTGGNSSDDGRENEGDLIFPAQTLTEVQMAMLIRHCSDIVCLCLTQEKATLLDLPPMVAQNSIQYGTAFTVSIDGRAWRNNRGFRP